ncbi:hypothetical protein CCACVL1_29406 [Corchorus capsularis]|uniref:Uncharacterized protein n=1 Tax=Corchorus capsularis TaxID=210143 RepID=A0A1R3G1T7_COCAP|nr:hypothetical protein CCACVL1_29406 [Corchorus capsularis]
MASLNFEANSSYSSLSKFLKHRSYSRPLTSKPSRLAKGAITSSVCRIKFGLLSIEKRNSTLFI